MVVDESVEVRVREPDGGTERKRLRLDRFRPPTWRNTLRPGRRLGVIPYVLCLSVGCIAYDQMP